MGAVYMSEAKSWINTPPCVGHGRQDMVPLFVPRGKGVEERGDDQL